MKHRISCLHQLLPVKMPHLLNPPASWNSPKVSDAMEQKLSYFVNACKIINRFTNNPEPLFHLQVFNILDMLTKLEHSSDDFQKHFHILRIDKA